MVSERDLEQLLEEAREASPSTRLPEYRDVIARFGAEAIEPLAIWLEEPVLAAFAIRTLQRIVVIEPSTKREVVAALGSADRSILTEALIHDLDDTLHGLGVDPAKPRTRGSHGAVRPLGSPGRPGRVYWAMRTSPWERPYIWSEAIAGRLRQGWGWAEEQVCTQSPSLVRRGGELSEEQQMAWPSRRMLSTEPDGMRPGDLILAPNLPEWGRLTSSS